METCSWPTNHEPERLKKEEKGEKQTDRRRFVDTHSRISIETSSRKLQTATVGFAGKGDSNPRLFRTAWRGSRQGCECKPHSPLKFSILCNDAADASSSPKKANRCAACKGWHQIWRGSSLAKRSAAYHAISVLTVDVGFEHTGVSFNRGLDLQATGATTLYLNI
jgi:hypothetical protein